MIAVGSTAAVNSVLAGMWPTVSVQLGVSNQKISKHMILSVVTLWLLTGGELTVSVAELCGLYQNQLENGAK